MEGGEDVDEFKNTIRNNVEEKLANRCQFWREFIAWITEVSVCSEESADQSQLIIVSQQSQKS